MPDLDYYLSLITSQHRNKPRFMAFVRAALEPYVQAQVLLEEMRATFDLDSAIGVQLDQTGQWIGRTRYLRMPLEDVYFSWDTPDVGWDEGHWKGPYDPDSKLLALDDETYRTLLYAKAAANHWDGTIPGAYAAWEMAFAPRGSVIIIQDNQDMSMTVGITGLSPDSVTKQLILQGYLPLKPEGVRIASCELPPDGGRLFAWDCDSDALAGWDEGRWPISVSVQPDNN